MYSRVQDSLSSEKRVLRMTLEEVCGKGAQVIGGGFGIGVHSQG